MEWNNNVYFRTYPRGTYFKSGANDGKDIRFQISGASVSVAPVNNPPVFTLNPVNNPAATVGSAYAGSIAANASDPDGDALSFSKVSGPAWLNVATSGALSGSPTAGDVGPNSFVVLVTDPGGLSGSATLNITVSEPVLDTDNDGMADNLDNCIEVANADQRDTDGDGYGNLCDPDFDGNLVVNAADLANLKTKFFGTDPDADLNGDGVVNAADLAILKTMFFKSPGPSATLQ